MTTFSMHSELCKVLSLKPGPHPSVPTRLVQTLAQGAQQMLVKGGVGEMEEGSMDVADPPRGGITSYLSPLSLQTQAALVHPEVPWGLHALSGPRVPPSQALLKTEMAVSELGP